MDTWQYLAETRLASVNLQKDKIEELELASQKKLMDQLLTEFTSVKNTITELRKEKSSNSLEIASLNKEEY